MLSKYCIINDEKIMRSIKLLETTCKTWFKIGKEGEGEGKEDEFKLPGHIDIIILNTPIYDFVFDGENKGNNIEHIANHISIPEDERPGFCTVWLYLNGLLTADTLLENPNNINDLLNIYKWMNYFNVSRESWFYDRYKNDFLVNNLKSLDTIEELKEKLTNIYKNEDKYSKLSIILAILLGIKAKDHFKYTKKDFFKKSYDEKMELLTKYRQLSYAIENEDIIYYEYEEYS